MDHHEMISIVYPAASNQNLLDPDFKSWLKCLNENHFIHNLRLLDSGSLDSENTKNQLDQIKKEIVLFYITDIILIHRMRSLMRSLKINNKFICVGGEPAISINAKELLETFDFLDVIIRGPETENVLIHFLNQYTAGTDFQKIHGITYRDPSCKSIFHNPNLALSDHLDHLILTTNTLNEPETGSARPGGDWHQITTSRGCGYNCQYCGYQLPFLSGYKDESNYWRAKSPGVIVDEMEYLMSRGGNQFTFRCNQFFQPHQTDFNHAEGIAREILSRKLKIKFRFSAKPADLKKNLDTLFILKEAGLAEINIGIDSGLPRFFSMYKSGSNPEDAIYVLQFLHQHHFNFDIGFIFYDPFLSLDEVKNNIAFLKKINPYFSHLARPFCGFLDSRILINTLFLRIGMPIISHLKEHHLLVEYPEFSAHPAAKMKDPAVMYIYSIYRAMTQIALPHIRPLFYDKALVAKFPWINLFLLELMEEIVRIVEQNKLPTFNDYVSSIEAFIKNSFRPYLLDILNEFNQYRTEPVTDWMM